MNLGDDQIDELIRYARRVHCEMAEGLRDDCEELRFEVSKESAEALDQLAELVAGLAGVSYHVATIATVEWVVKVYLKSAEFKEELRKLASLN